MLPTNEPAPEAPRRRFRKLRIVWSVGWGIISVMLTVLLVRSYWRMEGGMWALSSKKGIIVSSQFGGLLTQYRDATGTPVILSNHFQSFPTPDKNDGAPAMSFTRLAAVPRDNIVVFPYWLLILSALVLGAMPWLPRRLKILSIITLVTFAIVATI
jgi:hypothetical protein